MSCQNNTRAHCERQNLRKWIHRAISHSSPTFWPRPQFRRKLLSRKVLPTEIPCTSTFLILSFKKFTHSHFQATEIRQEARNWGGSPTGRYSRLFSVLFWDGDFPQEKKKEWKRERKRGKTPVKLSPLCSRALINCGTSATYLLFTT